MEAPRVEIKTSMGTIQVEVRPAELFDCSLSGCLPVCCAVQLAAATWSVQLETCRVCGAPQTAAVLSCSA